MKKQFAVIGLGSFGQAVARELMSLGHQVLGVERDEDRANRLSDVLTQVVIGDAGDERVITELGLDQYNAVLVAIGENLEASILCTMHLKTAGVEQVWVKAITSAHHRIVELLGASRIIHPELEMGQRVAQTLTYPNMLDYISLGDGYFVIEIRPGEGLEGYTVDDLELERHEVHLMAIKHGKELQFEPGAGYELKRNDHLLVLGLLEPLRNLTDSMYSRSRQH